jgi:hypothetical protein
MAGHVGIHISGYPTFTDNQFELHAYDFVPFVFSDASIKDLSGANTETAW